MLETPLKADALADSIAVNAGPLQNTTAAQFTAYAAALKLLRVRHLRAGILDNDPSYDADLVEMLSAAHARLDGITDCTGIEYYANSPTSPYDIRQFDKAIGYRLEDVEGPNEVDNRNDPNWASDTVACLPSLRSAKPGLPFLAPTLANQLGNAPALGNISAMVDQGNFHRYYAGRNPGTAGYGTTYACGTYGSLPFSLCETRINSGTKPVMITETGYNSVSEVDEPTQAKYLSRMFLVDLAAGISRTYVYTLADYTPSDDFSNDGLLRSDLTMKPAFYALASEIAFFSDRGAVPTQVPLQYSISGGPTSLDHLLFQRRDGAYILALWNETASWDTVSSQPIAVAPAAVTVSLPFLPLVAKAVSIDDAGALVPKVYTRTLDTFTLPVDDHVTFLKFSAL
jgi:hypothetical protein